MVSNLRVELNSDSDWMENLEGASQCLVDAKEGFLVSWLLLLLFHEWGYIINLKCKEQQIQSSRSRSGRLLRYGRGVGRVNM